MKLALEFLAIFVLAILVVALFTEGGILFWLPDDLKNRNDRGKLKRPSSKNVV